MLCFGLFLSGLPATAAVRTEHYSIAGKVIDAKSRQPVPFAVVATAEKDCWTTADKNACFVLDHISAGEHVLNVYSLGYVVKSLKIQVSRNITGLCFSLEPQTLELDQVVITADSKTGKSNSSSSYKVDRTALDHLQATDITDVMSLLPGGKFKGDINLTNAPTRFEVHGSSGELNSSSFSTAVEIDGVKMSNNADYGKLQGIDSRSIPITNVESVEIVTGIPSVEYGDLNSGLVKISTAKGRTPFVVELVTRPNTHLLALRKGFNIGQGTLNASLERARSISNLLSPYTSYDRNGLTLNYNLHLKDREEAPLLFSAGFSGNLGGYDSKADPDQIGKNYEKERQNGFRLNAGLKWVPGTRLLNSLDWTASLSYTDNLSTWNEIRSESASDVAIHTTENGYHVAEDYDVNPDAPVILLKPGTWYELRYYSNRPLYFNTKLKAESKNSYGRKIFNHVMLGAEYSYAHNLGRGTCYDDLRYAPSWREYLLYEDPAMHDLSVFLEDNLTLHTGKDSYLKFMAGVRSDFTFIRGSEYRTVPAVSPRFNLEYVVWENKDQFVSDLKAHVGWGRAVKLPSFNILYPRPQYMDLATFSTASDAENVSFQAYRTFINTPVYNKNLKWQSSDQFEIGAEMVAGGFGLRLLFFMNDVNGTYLPQQRYLPFSYNYTGPSALEGLPIPSADRSFQVDRNTGIVTVSDKTGKFPAQELDHVTYRRFIPDSRYVNGSPSRRMGLEYVLTFPRIEAIHTQLRIDGNYYRYRGVNEVISQDAPGLLSTSSGAKAYKYIAHYAGPAAAVNGNLTQDVNLNVMLTTHIPKIRMVISLRLESTLLSRSQNLSESSRYQRSAALENPADYISSDGDIYNRNRKVASYPMYYSTWERPDELIPFMDKFIWAKENDPVLYADLSKLVKKSNYQFIFDERRISPYYSVNLNLTKEFGDFASVSFYATNFLNNMQTVRSNWPTMKESSIYGKGYIPRFSYGLSVRLKF